MGSIEYQGQKFFSSKDSADFLGLSVYLVNKLGRYRELDRIKIGAKYYYSVHSLHRYIIKHAPVDRVINEDAVKVLSKYHDHLK